MADRKLLIENNGMLSTCEILDEMTLIGRDASCHVVLDTQKASRRHLKISQVGRDLIVEDLSSSNGTLLNGTELKNKTIVQGGDRLEIGDVAIHIDFVRPARVLRDPGTSRSPVSRSTTPLITAGLALLFGIVLIWSPWSRSAENTRGGSDSVTTADQPVASKATQSTGQPENNRSRSGEPDAEDLGRRLQDLDTRVRELLLNDRFREADSALHAFERIHGKSGTGPLRHALTHAASETGARWIKETRDLLVAGHAETAVKRAEERLQLYPEEHEVYGRLVEIEKDARRVLAANEKNVVAANGAKTGSPKSGLSEATRTTSDPKRLTTLEQARADAEHWASDGRKHFEDRRFKEAADRFESALRAATDGVMPGVFVQECRRQLAQSRRLSDVLNLLGEAMSRQPEVFRGIPVLPAANGDFAGLEDGEPAFEIGGDRTVLAWKVLRAEALSHMILKVEWPAKESLTAAGLLLALGNESAGHHLLRRLEIGADETQKRAIDEVLAEGFGSDVPEGGFIWHESRYLSPRDLKRLRDRETMTAALADLGSDSSEKRRDAMATLASLGDAAKSNFHRGLLELKAANLQRLEKTASYKKILEVHTLRLQVDAARQSALDLIFDEEKYPYPYRDRGPEILAIYTETQREIDNRTAALRKLWDSELKATVSADVRLILDRLGEIDVALLKLDLGMGASDPAAIKFLPAGQVITVKNFALDSVEREDIDRSAEWMQFNDSEANAATVTERAQVRITNEYRIMMGRHAVKIDDRLIACARGHSDDMAKLGFFAHENPFVAERRSPWDRARLAGFPGGGVSENIARAGGAANAHNSWIHSSGHHRNILGRSWRRLGSGQSGNHWTQNFAVEPRGDETETREGKAER